MKNQKMEQIQVKYKTGIFRKQPAVWMELPDKTILLICDKKITIGYTKKAFKKKFEEVIKSKKEKYFLTTWTFNELYVILNVLKKLESELNKIKQTLKGGNKNDRTKNHKKTI